MTRKQVDVWFTMVRWLRCRHHVELLGAGSTADYGQAETDAKRLRRVAPMASDDAIDELFDRHTKAWP